MVWTSGFAYVVGLITTDGNLSKDGRHIELTSKDIDQIETFTKLLNLKNKIGIKSSGHGSNKPYFRVQFGNVKLYKFLLEIGLLPNKTKVLGELKIPDDYFIDFLRGHFDGDGYTYSYWDKRWKNSFMLYTGFCSASEKHLIWLKEQIKRLYGLNGALKFEGKSTYSLKYAKYSSIVLLGKMYYRTDIPCLKRKYLKVVNVLDIINNLARVEKLVNSLS